MQDKEIYLVYADSEYGSTHDNGDGTADGDEGSETYLRGIADTPAAAAGLILKDYVQTVELEGLSEEDFPLVRDPSGDDDAFFVDIRGSEGPDTWHNTVRWYVKAFPVNELLEDE